MMGNKSKTGGWAMAVVAALSLSQALSAQEVEVSPNGDVKIPATSVPSTPLMSEEGNRYRAEHILTERTLKGQPIDAFNAALFGKRVAAMKAAYPQVTLTPDSIGGIPVVIYSTGDAARAGNRQKVLINVHGGGFVGCFVECSALESIPIAAGTGLKIVSIDYRKAPAARFPAASEDVAAVYGALLQTFRADRIGIFGCSAGGLLTAQSLAWFQSHKLPVPAAAGIFCAGADARMGGDSRYVGMLLGDGEIPRTGAAPPLGYMTGASTSDPNAFPAIDDHVLAKFPPTLIISGTRDFGLSGAVNLHSKLVAQGVDARLHIWEGGRHAFFYDPRVPESRQVYTVIAEFMKDRLGRAR